SSAGEQRHRFAAVPYLWRHAEARAHRANSVIGKEKVSRKWTSDREPGVRNRESLIAFRLAFFQLHQNLSGYFFESFKDPSALIGYGLKHRFAALLQLFF